MKDNKLIAEFMGVKPPLYMEYHTSWDWLMPVVEKIGELYHTITIETNNESDQCVILCYKEDEKYRRIFEVGLTLHEATYKAVVEFIKTYNDER